MEEHFMLFEQGGEDLENEQTWALYESSGNLNSETL